MGETQTGRGRSGPSFATIVLVALLAAGVIGALIGVVIVRATSSDVAALTLEPANAAGANPFTDSVAAGGPAVNPNVQTAVAATRASFSTDPDTGALVAPADAPGLYGGSGDTKVCNPQQLADFLTQDQAKAKAWASVLDISTDDITTYITSLTPVLLTNDTLVTNHGYNNGKATSLQSVLQAGTAVMVDATGTPRVKCNCGNPLTEPQTITLSSAKLTGTAWPNYTINNFTTIHATTQITNLVIINIQTGTTYTQPLPTPYTPDTPSTSPSERSGGGVVVALGIAGLGEEPTTPISISTNPGDYASWEAVATIPDALYGIGFGDGSFVAVGDEAIYSSDATGRSWTKAGAVPAYLSDVSYGDGKWLAVGTSSGPASTEGGVVYESVDAQTWTKVDTPLLSTNDAYLVSVAFGDGLWVVSVSTGSAGSALFTSRDGRAWDQATASPAGSTLGHDDGAGWLNVGWDSDGDSGVGFVWRSVDGTAWTRGSATLTEPSYDNYSVISFSGSAVFVDGRWYVASWNPGGLGPQGIVTSTDGSAWTLAADESANDLAYG